MTEACLAAADASLPTLDTLESAAGTAGLRRPPPWTFAVLALVNGVFQSYLITPLPYLLRQTGYPVDRIAAMVAFVLLPMAVYFLWSPLVDLWLPRRVWIVLLSLMSGLLLGGAVPLLARHTGPGLWLLFLGYAVSLMSNSAAGGLLALTQHGSEKGTAAAWMQGGGLAATALGGAALLYSSKHLPLPLTSTVAALLVALPGLIALFVREPAPPRSMGSLADYLATMTREMRHTLLSWKALPSILLLISPIGTGAAQSLFVAMAPEYHVGARGVMLLSGLMGGVLTMGGALSAVILPARWDRRLAYAGAGVVCAGTGLLLACAPVTPVMYFLGVGAYLLSVGVCYALFLGVVMYTMGEGEASASTRFTLLVSLGNLPIVYMTRLEGWGYQHFGVRGVPAIDAAGNLAVGACVVVAVAWRTLARRRAETK